MKQTCLYRPGIGGAPDCGLRDDADALRKLVEKQARYIAELEAVRARPPECSEPSFCPWCGMCGECGRHEGAHG